jgi:hypothetical protein
MTAYVLLSVLKVVWQEWHWEPSPVVEMVVLLIFAVPVGLLVWMVWRGTAAGTPRQEKDSPRLGWADFIAYWVVLVGFLLYIADSSLNLGIFPTRRS